MLIFLARISRSVNNRGYQFLGTDAMNAETFSLPGEPMSLVSEDRASVY